MKTIYPTAILDYCDGVLAFEGRDDIGGHYIGAAVKPEGGYDRYLVTGARPERLRQFRSGILDLRTLLLEAPGGEWYITLTDSDPGAMLALEPQAGNIADAGELLPLEGYTLDSAPVDDLALEQARARNNVVFEFSAEPPETAVGHRIRTATLGSLLLQIQAIIKHAYESALRDLTDSVRRKLDTTDGHLMDVVIPAAPGSYRVVLEAAKAPDLFGSGELVRGLRRLDQVFTSAHRPDAARELLQPYKGHLAGSYIKLMHFLADKQTGLSYSWADPIALEAHHNGVSGADAGKLSQLFSEVTNLATESITVSGTLQQFNRSAGTWGLFTAAGVTTGKIADNGPTMDGLEVGSYYQFNCIEEIEIDYTGREKRILYLQSIADA